MNKLLAKIFNLNRNGSQSNGTSSVGLLRQIDRLVLFNTEKIINEVNLHDHFISLISDLEIAGEKKVLLQYSELSGTANWFDVAEGQRVPADFSSWINSELAESFNVAARFESGMVLPGEEQAQPLLLMAMNTQYRYLLKCDTGIAPVHFYEALAERFAQMVERFNHAKELASAQAAADYLRRDLREKESDLRIAEKAVKRKVYDLHNLVEASNEIYSILNIKQLVNSALLTLIGQVGFQSAFIIMYSPEERRYQTTYHKGFRDDEIEKLTFSSDDPVARFFLKHRTPVSTEKLERQGDLKDYTAKLGQLGIFLVAPIIYSERLQGIIGTREKLYGSKFVQTDFEIFHILVNIISISIGNARLYEEVKNLSLTDGMTQLHNYRYFEDRLKEELNRARRNNTKVSLMMLDIDHFKNYNDTLGHQAGDDALRQIGKVLKTTVRDEDIVTRYGGEEFGIILPGIEKKGLLALGDRVRKTIEKSRFYKEEVQPAGKITVSLGAATYPDDASGFDDLVHRADQGLYQAKSMGRNQVRIYETPKKG